MPFQIRESKSALWLEWHIPESANAMSLEASRALAKIARANRGWSKAVIVSSAHPRLFCSGGNLSDYKKLRSKASGLKINREIARNLDVFGRWPAVKLALIEGDVLGGGLEWLARFDYRWCTSTVVFSFWQRRIGLSSGWGGGRVWADKIGEDRVRMLLLEGELLSAESALRFGLCDRIVQISKIRVEAEIWAERMAAQPTRDLLSWSARTEARVFSKLWLGPLHKTVLARWK